MGGGKKEDGFNRVLNNTRKEAGCSKRFRCKARKSFVTAAYFSVRRSDEGRSATPQMGLFQQSVKGTL
jgi:hypothetical protein